MNLQKLFYILASAIIFFILNIYFLHPINIDIQNSDLGRHLLLGKIIITSGHVPLTNLLSYTNTNSPFINTHWLSEVFFYIWHQAFGFNGLELLSVFLISVTFALLFFYSSKRFHLFPALIVSLLYLQVLSERTEVRPELFSFLFLSIFIIILYKYRNHFTKWIFLLIPIELLWVNFHIYFFVGIITILLFLIEDFIIRKDKILSKKRIALLVVLITSSIVTLLNPNILQGADYPLFVLNNYGFSIQENTNFLSAIGLYKDPSFLYFGIAIIFLGINLSVAFRKIPLVDFFMAFTFTCLGIFAVRDFPLFVIGTFIPCVRAFSYLWTNIVKNYRKKNLVTFEVLLFFLVFTLLIPIMKTNIDNHGVGFGIIDNTQNAIDFIKKNSIKGTIYNNFDLGNYLEYRLYPEERVFVDNRPEAYPKDFFQDIYFPMQTNQDLFNQQSNKYNFNVLVIDHTDVTQGIEQQLYGLIRNNKWKLVFLNSTVALFVKNTPENHSIIKTDEITEKSPIPNTNSLDNKNNVRQLANFYRAVNWPNQQLSLYIKYLNFDPKNCVVLRNVAYMLQQQQSPELSNYLYKYQTSCQ